MMKSLQIAIQTKTPVLLWGSPGTGKTSFINQLAQTLGWHLEVVLASIREPSDFAGLPIIGKEGVRMEPPAWAKNLAQAGNGILFLDEISTAPPAVQAALLRVVLDRVVGDLPLPEGVAVVAAANPPEEAAGGWDLSAPLANRFCHLYWQVNPDTWVQGMLDGFNSPEIIVLPGNWENLIPAQRVLVASFIRHRRHLLMQVPKDESQAGKAWASPRSWSMAARLMAGAEAVGEEDTIPELIAGCVGEGVAYEFLAWKKNLDLPNPEDILANPQKFILPNRGDKAFAVLSSVVAYAVNNMSRKMWDAAWQVIILASQQGGKDIAASVVPPLAKAKKPDFPIPKGILEFQDILRKGGLLDEQSSR